MMDVVMKHYQNINCNNSVYGSISLQAGAASHFGDASAIIRVQMVEAVKEAGRTVLHCS